MLNIRKIYIGLTLLLPLLLMGNFSSAAQPGNHPPLQSMQGTINRIDVNRNLLIVNDMSYTIGSDVMVKTAAGNQGRLGQLYPGKRVRMDVEFNDNMPGIIHTIYLLR